MASLLCAGTVLGTLSLSPILEASFPRSLLSRQHQKTEVVRSRPGREQRWGSQAQEQDGPPAATCDPSGIPTGCSSCPVNTNPETSLAPPPLPHARHSCHYLAPRSRHWPLSAFLLSL